MDFFANRIEIDRSTAVTSGTVTESDLTDITFCLFDDAALLYEDVAIVGGSVQPIGGVPRVLGATIDFAFDLDAFVGDPSFGLLQFDNDLVVDQDDFDPPSATGTTFNIYGGLLQTEGIFAAADRHVDGAFDGVAFDSGSATFNTTRNDAVVPLPAALPLVLTGLAAIGLVARRRS